MTQGHQSVLNQEMRSTIGIESEPATYEVEKGDIIRFANAISDSNPIFNDDKAARQNRYGGLIAPPTFLRSMNPGPAKIELPNPYPAILDGGSKWEYFEPVRPGDRITVVGKIVDMSERQGQLGNMLFVVREIKYRNQFGNPVAIQLNTEISYQPQRGESQKS